MMLIEPFTVVMLTTPVPAPMVAVRLWLVCALIPRPEVEMLPLTLLAVSLKELVAGRVRATFPFVVLKLYEPASTGDVNVPVIPPLVVVAVTPPQEEQEKSTLPFVVLRVRLVVVMPEASTLPFVVASVRDPASMVESLISPLTVVNCAELKWDEAGTYTFMSAE